jgi:hypothetical protein
MLETYLRRVLLGAALCLIGGAFATGAACTTSPHKALPGTTGAAGNASTGGGTAGTSSTGTAGSSSGTAGSASGTAGMGAAGDASGGGTAGAGGTPAGTAGAAAGAGGAAGSTNGTVDTAGASGTAGAGGAAGTVADNSLRITDAFPIAVTKYWFASGWDGDAATRATFGTAMSAIKIENQTTPTPATSGPCSKRVAGAIGDCFKITYTPVMSDAGATKASVALIPELPMGGHNYSDATMAPHLPAGAMKITAEVAGDVGGEVVQFNLWTTNSGDLFTPTFAAGAAAQTWQKLTSASPATTILTTDQELSPFGWGSSSTTPIVFYYDDIRIENTP